MLMRVNIPQAKAPHEVAHGPAHLETEALDDACMIRCMRFLISRLPRCVDHAALLAHCGREVCLRTASQAQSHTSGTGVGGNTVLRTTVDKTRQAEPTAFSQRA